jgi:hypothetical protein
MSRYRTNVALSLKGDRIERGAEIELSAEEVAQLDPADISPVDAAPAPSEEAPAEVPLEEMSQAQLKARAKELGLSQSGSNADLRERIMLHLAGNADDQSDEEGSEGADESADDQSDEEGSEGAITSE